MGEILGIECLPAALGGKPLAEVAAAVVEDGGLDDGADGDEVGLLGEPDEREPVSAEDDPGRAETAENED